MSSPAVLISGVNWAPLHTWPPRILALVIGGMQTSPPDPCGHDICFPYHQSITTLLVGLSCTLRADLRPLGRLDHGPLLLLLSMQDALRRPHDAPLADAWSHRDPGRELDVKGKVMPCLLFADPMTASPELPSGSYLRVGRRRATAEYLASSCAGGRRAARVKESCQAAGSPTVKKKKVMQLLLLLDQGRLSISFVP